jgi:hypothetical protein
MEGYCLKCRTKHEMKNATSVTLKNDRPATQGACPVCGTRLPSSVRASSLSHYLRPHRPHFIASAFGGPGAAIFAHGCTLFRTP